MAETASLLWLGPLFTIQGIVRSRCAWERMRCFPVQVHRPSEFSPGSEPLVLPNAPILVSLKESPALSFTVGTGARAAGFLAPRLPCFSSSARPTCCQVGRLERPLLILQCPFACSWSQWGGPSCCGQTSGSDEGAVFSELSSWQTPVAVRLGAGSSEHS